MKIGVPNKGAFRIPVKYVSLNPNLYQSILHTFILSSPARLGLTNWAYAVRLPMGVTLCGLVINYIERNDIFTCPDDTCVVYCHEQLIFWQSDQLTPPMSR